MGETIKCWNCLSVFQEEEADWCAHSPATKICPFCFKCGCQAPEKMKEEQIKKETNFEVKKIGEILLEAGKLEPGHLQEALSLQKVIKKKIGEILVMMSLINENELKLYLLNQKKIEKIDLKNQQVDLAAVDKLGEQLCLNYKIIPIEVEELQNSKMLRFAFYSFDQLDKIRKSEDFKNFRLIPYLAEEKDIHDLLELIADSERTKVQLYLNQESFDALKLLNSIIFKAIFFGASQINIVWQEGLITFYFRLVELVVRYQTISDENEKIFLEIGSFFKIPRGQSGFQFQIKLGGNFSDYRITGFFMLENEQKLIGLKIINEKELTSGIEVFNLTEDEHRIINEKLNQNGLFLVIIPPFSSAEKALYPLMQMVNHQKVLSVESKIYCRLPDKIQILHQGDEVDRQLFLKWLEMNPRSIFLTNFFEKDYPSDIFQLCSDRQVFLLINLFSVEQALTKLISLFELEDDFFCKHLRLIMRCREVKLLCPLCKKKVINLKDILKFLPLEKTKNIFEENGCSSCYFSGYYGRDLVIELLPINEEHCANLKVQAINSALSLNRGDLLTLQDKMLLKMQLGRISLREFLQVF